MQAALGVAQLERIDELIAVRLRNAAHYQQRLLDVPGLSLAPCANWADNVYWMYSVLVEKDFGLDRDAVMACLGRRGIEARPVFYPIHTLPMYDRGQRFPVAEEIGRKGINLPSGATLTPEQVDLVCDALLDIYRRGE
jgi:perosamine synthetase